VSNLEKDPAEVLLTEPGAGVTFEPADGVEILAHRDVPLGGPRAMSVRRTLPQRARSLIGAWCFIDHYGPDEVVLSSGMTVPPHPHTGLQTVSWLFAGEIDHRDSVGSHALVRPGELNLMTAGAGIQHSEVSTPAAVVLHGAQLWVALPNATRHSAPMFEHFVPEPFEFEGARVSVFLGSLLGRASTATTFSPLVGAQLDVPAGATVTVPVASEFEHGILVDSGAAVIDGHAIARDSLGYFPLGRSSLTITAGDDALRILLIGGEPLGERIVMWWNFIGRTHDEIVRFREQWQLDVVGDEDAAGRFGHVVGYDGRPLPAPELPNVRLQPRG
jgi:redox-sensitive bicupin YhaK (pirin superfamily)